MTYVVRWVVEYGEGHSCTCEVGCKTLEEANHLAAQKSGEVVLQEPKKLSGKEKFLKIKQSR